MATLNCLASLSLFGIHLLAKANQQAKGLAPKRSIDQWCLKYQSINRAPRNNTQYFAHLFYSIFAEITGKRLTDKISFLGCVWNIKTHLERQKLKKRTSVARCRSESFYIVSPSRVFPVEQWMSSDRRVWKMVRHLIGSNRANNAPLHASAKAMLCTYKGGRIFGSKTTKRKEDILVLGGWLSADFSFFCFLMWGKN